MVPFTREALVSTVMWTGDMEVIEVTSVSGLKAHHLGGCTGAVEQEGSQLRTCRSCHPGEQGWSPV